MKFKRRFRRKFKYNKKRSFMFILFFLVCLSFGLGYSLIQTDINIFGTTVLKDNRWDVHFDNIQEVEDSVSPTSEPEITDNTTVSFSAKLKKPGDKYEFLIDVVNAGTIDAKIASITLSPELTLEQQNYFAYEVKYESGLDLSENQALDAGTTETLKVSFNYLEQEDNSLYPGDNQTFNVNLTLDYVQGTGTPLNHPYLYNVLMNEAESGGLAKKYTGEHHDSFTEEPSKDIYHWYATNDIDGTEVLNKNNVIFANHCWEMIRTTDTGGVKMIYNGEAENNQCLTTRGKHVGYSSITTQTLSSNYWYGTDYTYDSRTNKFSVSGITEQATWNASTAPGLVGKYTCKSTSNTGICSTLYLVESYNNNTKANVIPLNTNSNYDNYGTVQYNQSVHSPSSAGYMYGEEYTSNNVNDTSFESVSEYINIISNTTVNTSSFWYGTNLSYSNGNYSIENAVNLADNTLAAIGKTILLCSNNDCTAGTTVSSNTALYVVDKIDDTHFYTKKLEGGKVSTDYKVYVGESAVAISNGYTLSGNIASVSIDSWYNNYNNYLNKYICSSNTTSNCSKVYYIKSVDKQGYKYISYYGEVNNNILISKSRNGMTLSDTLLVSKSDWIDNYSNYSDYKYTCNNTNSVCEETTLRFIVSFSSSGYTYVPNRYFASNVTWDGTNYTLQNTIEVENYNDVSQLSNHHYYCLNNGPITCSKVAYIYYYSGSGLMYYIILKNGVTSVSEALNSMLNTNTNNSTIKTAIDAWYNHYMLDYDDYIEDTIFCNIRSISQIGGWKEDGGKLNVVMRFREYSTTTNLNCPKTSDKFSILNNEAKLIYKVGLSTIPEMKLMNNSNARKSTQNFWLASPRIFTGQDSRNSYIETNGDLAYYYVIGIFGVRPTISLKPKTIYLSGDGSMESPYIIN